MTGAASDVTAAKAALRTLCRARRRARSATAQGTGDAIAGRALDAMAFPPGAAVAGYWPFHDEADPRPLMTALAARGHRLCLPVVVARGRPLVFRVWVPGDVLETGVFGTSVPCRGAEECTPSIVLAPLLAVDRRGFRLGYGGGYYDRTLAVLNNVLAVGIAFHDQICDMVPHDAHDRPLDWLASEREAFHCRGATAE